MERKQETGCQTPEGPILCVNNCGFFGSATTAYMCSKCHKEMLLKEHASSSIETLINGSATPGNVADRNVSDSVTGGKDPVIASPLADPKTPINTVLPGPVGLTEGSSADVAASAAASESAAPAQEDGPKRCFTCHKRVRLTGFSCKCGNLFCGAHRYSDKHECPFDYRRAGQEAIAKANPVVKADKLDKI